MVRPWRGSRVFVLFFLALSTATIARAEEKPLAKGPERTQFLRIIRDEKEKPLAMETAIVRYVPADKAKPGPVVDLIAAVHVGEKSYYEQLNKEFENYDAMLYELVAPTGTKVSKKAADNRSAVSSLQVWMKGALALEFQLEQVDYHAKNFVHADMTPEQFSRSMRDKKEDPLTLFLKLMQASMAQQAQQKEPVNNTLLLAALFDKKNGPLVLKRIMADQLDSADTLLEALNGPAGSTLITERNKVALKVLGQQFAAGKKRFAIFYGTGHMPDMEKRLLDQFALQRGETRWLQAWDLKPSLKPAAKPQAEKAG